MKKLSALLLSICLLVAIMPACKKSKGGGGSGGSTEANLTVTTSPASNGQVEAPAPGPDFPLRVEVTSTMPPSGVRIQVSVKKDGTAEAPFFTDSRNTTSAVTNITITGSTKGIVNLVTITVTSLSKPTNVWTGTYKYSLK